MAHNSKISESEWEVMKVVWERPGVAATDIVEQLAGRMTWNHRTVKTLLTRLVKKGALRYTMEGNRYLYTATIEREDAIQRESRSFIRRVFDGATGPLLTHFVNTTELSDDDIQRLKAILEDKERKRAGD